MNTNTDAPEYSLPSFAFQKIPKDELERIEKIDKAYLKESYFAHNSFGILVQHRPIFKYSKSSSLLWLGNTIKSAEIEDKPVEPPPKVIVVCGYRKSVWLLNERVYRLFKLNEQQSQQ